jgi:hypothetical protein
MSKDPNDEPKGAAQVTAEDPIKQPDALDRRKDTLELWKVILSPAVALLGVIVTAIIGYLSLSNQVSNVQTKVNEVGNRVENVERNVIADRFIIVSPQEGDTVDSSVIVRGKTPYPDRNHYIVVTSLKTNDDYVQQNLIRPDPSGAWTGNAELGTGNEGAGEKFLVRVLATTAVLRAGPMKDPPRDAIPSEAITVTRKK